MLEMFPPIFDATTPAAVAVGAMKQSMALSLRMRAFPSGSEMHRAANPKNSRVCAPRQMKCHL